MLGQPVEQRRPELGLAVHQRLGRGVVLARAALDEVAGQRERRAGEADQRRRAELGDQRADGLGDVRDVARASAPAAGRGRPRCGTARATTGPTPGTMSRSTPIGLERHDDVGEEDRRVDAVAADRLQRDLGDEVGVGAGVEHRGALAQRAVLRQRPAGLAHEPDRRVRHRLAAAGAHEGGVARASRAAAPGAGDVASSRHRPTGARPPGGRTAVAPRVTRVDSRRASVSSVGRWPRCLAWRSRWCAGCGDEQVFEVPPCEDGHGEDCLDLACVACGFAIVTRPCTTTSCWSSAVAA